MKKPECYTLEVKQYLNEVRKLNRINMFLAGKSLQKEFFLTEKEADLCILYWIDMQCQKLSDQATIAE